MATPLLRTRFGKRRPAIFGGMILMIAAYLMFLIPTQQDATIGNTIFFGVALCLFYSFYTLTMVTYYATFSEIVDNESDRMFLSNVKSVCDIVYFILGYALLPILVNNHINISSVALIFLPLVLTMLIPLFMIRGDDNRNSTEEKEKSVSLVKSVAYTFKDKNFLLWMIVYFFMTMGVQLFLGGINEFFSTNDLPMTLVMMGAFAPVPFTLILFNYLTKKKGFGFSFSYTLIIYAVGMIAMFFGQAAQDHTTKVIIAIASAVIGSFGIGSLFSVSYSVPSQLAVEEQQRTGVSHSAMYFAVQGLFSGVAAGIATGFILVALKENVVNVLGMGEKSAVVLMTLLSGIACLVAFGFMFLLPKSIKDFGKKNKEEVEK